MACRLSRSAPPSPCAIPSSPTPTRLGSTALQTASGETGLTVTNWPGDTSKREGAHDCAKRLREGERKRVGRASARTAPRGASALDGMPCAATVVLVGADEATDAALVAATLRATVAVLAGVPCAPTRALVGEPWAPAAAMHGAFAGATE
eukprot:72832-Chlamydomonas_euryale.AAC.16